MSCLGSRMGTIGSFALSAHDSLCVVVIIKNDEDAY